MTGYYIFIVLASVILGCGVTLYFFVRQIEKSNQSGDSQGDFVHYTKQPMRIHEFNAMETYKDLVENRQLFDILKR